MTDIRHEIDRGLEALLRFARQQAALREEFEHSTPEFFRGPPPAEEPTGLLLAARRHVEWFLLERHSPSLRSTPIEALHPEWIESEAEFQPVLHPLLHSFVGIFAVHALRPGNGLVLADLAGLKELIAAEPEASVVAEAGDLIAGRIFPTGTGRFVLSSAAGYWRDERLGQALRRDLEAMRQARARKVMHVSQLELESLFFGARRNANDEDDVALARRFLSSAGLGSAHVDELLERLAAAPREFGRPVLGAQDTLGEILDELAFETGVDLEQARLRLMRAWSRLAQERPESAAAHLRPEDTAADARTAMAAFDAARRSGAGLDELFRKLEQDLGLCGAPGEEDGEDCGEDELLPDFPGVVGAIVQEFLWEVALTEPDRAQAWSVLEKLGRYGAEFGIIEELDGSAILRFATFWVLEYDELADEASVRSLVSGLSAFCEWTIRAHGLDLGAVREPLQRLLETLPRAWRANRDRTRTKDGEPGALFEFIDLAGQGEAELRASSGELRRARLPEAIARELESGDRLRLRFDGEERALVLCCYPPQIAALVSS